jgi:methyl-accepting chemotaxis protein
MPEYFDDVFSALQHAAGGLNQTTAALAQVVEGMRRAAEATKQAHGGQEDLRETVRRLEGLVLELLRRQSGSAA